jgi:NADPH-dependent curcumin reductase CurA
MAINRRFLLVRRPAGQPQTEDFRFVEAPVPDVGEGEFLVRNLFVSLDPAMRGWLDDRPSYQPPVPLGEVVRASGVGQVVKSRNPDFQEGSFLVGPNGIQDYALVRDITPFTRKVDGNVPLTHHLSVLGGPGLTAYFGMTRIAQVKAGETVLVSAAAGAVGSLAGQIAKIHGARTIGIAGGDEKCARLRTRYGYDAAIDYRGKGLAELSEAVKNAAPDGIDLMFENVGGEILDAGLANLRDHGRVALCGLISDYNRTENAYGSRAIWQLIVKKATIRGFLLSEFRDRFGEGQQALRGWLDEGLLQVDEHIEKGMERALPAFLRLFDGSNSGKMILQLDS